ncbi:MAG: hypothetical protein ACTHOK_12785 [Nocardioidaceae bacterium]
MSELLDVADELYALRPGEFTAARNARAKQAKGDGDKELAAQVSALRKPALAAWVVNMLVRHETEQVSQLLGLGESLRAAQAELDADALRELTRQRRQVTAAMSTRGRALAAELGEKGSEAVARQVEDTLHAAMVDTDAEAAVRSGLLTEPLTSTGLGTLDISDSVADGAALGRRAAPAPARASAAGLRAVPEPEPSAEDAERERAEAREQAAEALREAKAAADKAARKLDKTRKRIEKLDARSLQLAAEMEELRRRVAELEHRQEQADDELEEARDKQQRAEKRHRKAQDALEQVRARAEELA